MSYDPLTDTKEAIESLEDVNDDKLSELIRIVNSDLLPELKKIRMHLEIINGDTVENDDLDDDEI